MAFYGLKSHVSQVSQAWMVMTMKDYDDDAAAGWAIVAVTYTAIMGSTIQLPLNEVSLVILLQK